MTELRFKKLHPDAVLPSRAHATDAGYDLTAVAVRWEKGRPGICTVDFGLAVEVPEGHAGFIFPRSSIYKVDLVLSNAVGVIDSGYRGAVSANFRHTPPLYHDPYHGAGMVRGGDTPSPLYQKGDRVAQLVVMPVPSFAPEWADELAEADRGQAGFGSTGS